MRKKQIKVTVQRDNANKDLLELNKFESYFRTKNFFNHFSSTRLNIFAFKCLQLFRYVSSIVSISNRQEMHNSCKVSGWKRLFYYGPRMIFIKCKHCLWNNTSFLYLILLASCKIITFYKYTPLESCICYIKYEAFGNFCGATSCIHLHCLGPMLATKIILGTVRSILYVVLHC